MNNNNDQAQFAKNVYQVPGQQTEQFEAPILDDQMVDTQFTEIAREEVRSKFEEITKDLALSAAGIEAPKIVPVETLETHPDAVELLQIGNYIKTLRDKRHAELVEDIQTKRVFRKIVTAFFASNPSDSGKLKFSKEAVLHDLIEQESKIGATLFPSDGDVVSRKFFFLPNDRYDEWFHQQTSAIKSKDFTNSYIITEYGVQKSSTYFDEIEGRVKNVSVFPSDDEIKNLKNAATLYHGHVAGKVYAKPAGPRRRFSSKNDYDLAA